MKRKKKHRKLRKAWIPNSIVLTIFMIIIAYLVIFTGIAMTRVKPSIYRVISDTRTETINEKGVIIRDEVVNKTGHSGHINYYVNSLSLAGKKDIIYTVDSTGSIYSNLTSEEISSDEDENSIYSLFYRFQTDRSDFFSLYQLKSSLKEKAFIKSSQSVLTNLTNVIENYGNNNYFHVNYANESGIVVFGTDGFEDLKEENVDINTFQHASDTNLNLPPVNSSKIEEGSPVYKLIRDEEWVVIIPITDEQAEKLKAYEYVDTILDGSSFKAKAKVETFVKEESYFAKLTFYNYMVNFAEKRFISVFINLDSVTGLKIAKSAVVEKKFYIIPSDFLVKKDEKYIEKGINLLTFDKKGNPFPKFIETTVYLEKDGFSYIAADGEFSAGDRITKEKDPGVVTSEDGEYFTTISKTDKLSGVYNVNKGYPEFRRIEVISDIDSDYYLIADDTSFGLSDYDNIILNAKAIEGEKDD